MASRVSYLVYYYCKQSEFEILRCFSESIPMKVSYLLICIIRIMWRDLKKNCLSRFRDMQKRAKSPNFEWSCTYTVGEKTGWFQDCMNENTPMNDFPVIGYPCFAHRILGSPGGKHCESPQRNVWRGAVSPVKAVSLDRECNILPWFYEKRRWLMLVRRNCKFLWDQCDEIYR